MCKLNIESLVFKKPNNLFAPQSNKMSLALFVDRKFAENIYEKKRLSNLSIVAVVIT